MTVVWLVAIGVLVLIELLTYGLYFAALAVAAVVPLILSLLGAPVWLQALGFLGAAVVALFYVRPLIKKWQGDKPERMTNVDSLIGKHGIVLEEVTDRSGQIKIWGEVWTARSESAIPEGQKVVVEKIDGASLIVRSDV
jgi:membrane protein implicated in regulation of membrane protease activity